MNNLFSNIYQLLGYCAASDDIYTLSLYQTAGLVTLFGVGLSIFMYYYLFDSPKYIKAQHWMLLNFITAIVVTAICWILTVRTFLKEGLIYIFNDYASFIFAIFIFSLLLFLLFTLVFKWGSPNRRRTPF